MTCTIRFRKFTAKINAIIVDDLCADCLIGVDFLGDYPTTKPHVQALSRLVRKPQDHNDTDSHELYSSAITNNEKGDQACQDDPKPVLEVEMDSADTRMNGRIKSNDKDLKLTSAAVHTIELQPGNTAIKQKVRRTPYYMLEALKVMIFDILAIGLL